MRPGQRGIYIDLETGGLRPECDAILQIGVVTFEYCPNRLRIAITDRMNIVVPDHLYVCRRALQVQGKRFADVDDSRQSMSEIDAMSNVYNLICDAQGTAPSEWDYSRIWAHYAPFDYGFLHHMEKRTGIDAERAEHGKDPLFPPGGAFCCTKAYWKRLQHEGKAPAEISSKLDDLAAHFGIEKAKAHDAVGDCVAGIEVLEQMLRIDGKL